MIVDRKTRGGANLKNAKGLVLQTTFVRLDWEYVNVNI
jgi:hypothetical protein